MKAEIAVATVSGKAYYLIVSELRRRNVPFLSLTPKEPIPTEIKAVLTTEEEWNLIKHEKVLAYRSGTEPEGLINEALQIVEGKEHLEKIIIGVDPGEVFGLAVLADGKIIETANCFSIKETASKINSILENLKNIPAALISVKIGDGVPACKEKLLRTLDRILPPSVVLESVREAGTNRHTAETKHRRGLRDIVSATQIAGRSGNIFARRNTNESNG
jgi:hypothetical protein